MITDEAVCSWIFTARWGNDERIRLQMVDIGLRFFRVGQIGGGRPGTTLIRVTALSGEDGKHMDIPAKHDM